ncbi:AAA family ATPase [Phocaeicola sartorii]|jgi:predicted ATP-binding protein involved in virulence|uniref:AAA family ATPase n=1 Tax=Phocaeicola sartorii TaxID=671267 RepID=UPI00267000C9|nr:AAA family ATPase [Phocaeicola sartorii]
MKIENLHIKNIGPFKEAVIEFATEYNEATGEQPVTIITGMNGAGKSIVIDAIRAALSGQELERDIVADTNDFSIEMDVVLNGSTTHLSTSTLQNGHIRGVDYINIGQALTYGYDIPGPVNHWVIDYWSSKSPSDSFKIANMKNIQHEKALVGVMLGKKSNLDLINFICHIDYLRTSEMPVEKELGNMMYEKMKDVINQCLDNGLFKYVRRTDLTPIIEQNGIELSFDKLSSGNLFLIEHLLLLMCKMYSISILKQLPPMQIFNIPGLLLIDEIETHLHPKWQKKILGIIRSLFPNLQIILTTHSPFVVASMDGARIYTCVPQTGYSELRDETERYGHMPVEEILVSDIFGVQPFNEDITNLITTRKLLIENGKKEEARKVAEKLYEINPEYFSYLNIKNEFRK